MKILAVVLLMLVTIAAGVNSNLEQEANVLNSSEQDPNKMVESDLMASRTAWGVRGPDDRLISTTIQSADAFTFFVNDQEVTYRGHETTNITRIDIRMRFGDITQVDLLDGGLYHNYVTLRFTCQRSSSMYNVIDIYATINCHNN